MCEKVLCGGGKVIFDSLISLGGKRSDGDDDDDDDDDERGRDGVSDGEGEEEGVSSGLQEKGRGEGRVCVYKRKSLIYL